jgi:seryl-tRNA synthetase
MHRAREIGQLMAKGQKMKLKKEADVAAWKQHRIRIKLTDAKKTFKLFYTCFPIFPLKKCLPAKLRKIMWYKEGGTKPSLYKGAVPHWDLTKKYNLIDFELGIKLPVAAFRIH